MHLKHFQSRHLSLKKFILNTRDQRTDPTETLATPVHPHFNEGCTDRTAV
jgi:hypothetical protein